MDDRLCSGIRDNGKIPSLSFLEFSSVAGWTDLGQSAGDPGDARPIWQVLPGVVFDSFS